MSLSACLISGRAHLALAQKVSEQLDAALIDSAVRRFADGELHCQIQENVRGKDVFILQPTCAPVNENLMELLVMVDALKRASAKSIVAVVPYFGYARQDRKSAPRTPITAKLVADMLEVAGVTRVLTIDLHAESIQGFFNIPIDNLKAQSLFVEDAKAKHDMDSAVVVSPDIGGVVRARKFAEDLGVELAIVDKRRFVPNEAEIEHVIGDVKGKECIIVDDMVDTGGTICKASDFLIQEGGAKSVSVYASHGVLSNDAVERIENSSIQRMVVTDSLPIESKGKIETVSCDVLVAEAIACVVENRSMGDIA